MREFFCVLVGFILVATGIGCWHYLHMSGLIAFLIGLCGMLCLSGGLGFKSTY